MLVSVRNLGFSDACKTCVLVLRKVGVVVLELISVELG